MHIEYEERGSMIDIVKDEVAKKHMISGVETSLEIELEPSQEMPPNDTAENIITKEYERTRQPSGPLHRTVEGLDEQV